MKKPLDGVRVLDFTRVISGPFATQLLALLGADVIKFEKPGIGDETRQFCCNKELLSKGLGSAFQSVNAGKRSIALDLKDEASRDVVREMVARSDVVVENFRPGVMDRLGLGYGELKERKPDLIYCSVSGYGQDGPAANWAGYDGAMQAISGLMSITGFPECGPTRVGIPVIDMCSGYVAAFAIAASLFEREVNGKGRHIDVSMLDVSLSTIRSALSWWKAGGDPTLRGNQAWTRIPTSDSFNASDAPFMLTINTDDQFRKLVEVLGCEHLLEDPRFASWTARVENGAALRKILQEVFANDSAKNWERRLTAEGLVAAVVRSIPEALEHPQISHRKLLLGLQGANSSEVPLVFVNAPFTWDDGRPGVDRPPPQLGEDTEEILEEFGMALRFGERKKGEKT